MAIVAEKLYAGSRGRPAENFALLEKYAPFVYHLQFIVFLPRLHQKHMGWRPQVWYPFYRIDLVSDIAIFVLKRDVLQLTN